MKSFEQQFLSNGTLLRNVLEPVFVFVLEYIFGYGLRVFDCTCTWVILSAWIIQILLIFLDAW